MKNYRSYGRKEEDDIVKDEILRWYELEKIYVRRTTKRVYLT